MVRKLRVLTNIDRPMQIKMYGLILLGITALSSMSDRADALEDYAVVLGRMTWIVSDDLQNRYPNGELSQVRSQYFEKIVVQKEPSQLYRMDVTMPRTLTGGATLTTTYRQTFRPDLEEGEILFVNPSDSQDYVRCFLSDSWADTQCGSFTIRSLQSLPVGSRLQSSQQNYSGTNLAIGMGELTRTAGVGGEPVGTLALFDASQQDVPSWVGRWNITYTTPNHQVINGTMRVDGFIGVYQPNGSAARGSVTQVYFFDNVMAGNWQMGNARGWFRFERSGDSFTGQWGTDDSSDPLGTWNGSR